ncbi:prion-like-(Q/N-rich) domain-bearing protein 25 isoform X2 [Macrosteles quadrilineatus]|uniref:prion-like-(Q/N-rich) domain-bearing protein 25 isoform X2 n=1 Tax=Macrosteles quadrilineatus TaxID=74068 RepID=UPI0023E1D50F|nr:prion-like-(Q/N-rich) domain-bearing protein 25 isoform X2 [Macrosteles quadrilineatus]
MLVDNFQFTKSLLAFALSVNFILLCSYCAALVAKKINGSCKIDEQCTPTFGNHAFCFKNLSSEFGVCNCMRNTHYEDGLCYKSVPLGGDCQVDDDCVSVSVVPSPYCFHSKCTCVANYHPTEDHLDCLPDIGLGEKCTKDEDCVAGNSYCSVVCRCISGYAERRNKSTCLPAAKLREPCLDDSQCLLNLPNTFCHPQQNQCTCQPSSHEVNQTCWISAKLGEKCSHSNHCVTGTASMNSSVECSLGVCSCVSGYRRQYSDCVRLKDASADSSTLEKFVYLTIAVVLLSLPNDCTIC